MVFRNLKTSIKETHDWWYSDNLTDERRAKFEQRKGSILVSEKELIKKWKEHQKG